MNWNCILERLAETESTNDDLMARWRAGALIDPVSRLAKHQTKGKGRAGRQWFTEPNSSLSFSLAYPFNQPQQFLYGLSLVCGLAAIQGISKSLGLDEMSLRQHGLSLKWPNDLLINERKLGGILIEGGKLSSSNARPKASLRSSTTKNCRRPKSASRYKTSAGTCTSMWSARLTTRCASAA
mgnify:CR=1 FL=1